MRLVRLLSILVLGILLTTAPVAAQGAEIFPILSIDVVVNPNVWEVLVDDMKQESVENYTVICRSNASNAYIRIDFYNNNTLVDTDYFSFSNFTIFSFRLIGNTTKFDMIAENLGAMPIQIYLDLYNQTLENLQGITFIVSPEIFPIEYITENVTIIEKEYITITERIIEISDFAAAMVMISVMCIAGVYIAWATKKEQDKPINKISLDDLFDEYRKGK